MPTYLDRASLTALDPISCQLVSLLSGVDWPLASPFANSFSEFLFLLLSLPVTSRSRAQAFVWFRVKTDKGIVCLADHLHSVTWKLQLIRMVGSELRVKSRLKHRFWLVKRNYEGRWKSFKPHPERRVINMLNTEISSDLVIHFQLTHKQNEWINKQIKISRTYISVEKLTFTRCCLDDGETKMDKARRCTSRPSEFIQLKCNFKFTIKKVFFSTNHELSPPKFYRADSIPNVALKRLTKVLKKSVDPEGLRERERERERERTVAFGHDQRTLTSYQIKPRIPILVQDCL